MFRILLLFVLICTKTYSLNKVESAFVCLEQYDYFKAKKLFYRSLNKQTKLSSFGLANIFYRSDNPFHNLDSAYKYIMQAYFTPDIKAGTLYSKLAKEHKVDAYHIDSLKQIIFIESYKKEVKNKDSIKLDELEQFITFQKFSTFRTSLIRLRDSLAYQKAIQNSDFQSFQNLILDYPETQFLTQAKERMEWFQMIEFTKSDSTEVYFEFIDSFPKNRYVEHGKDILFSKFLTSKNVKGLERCIEKFPNHRLVNQAWKTIYAQSVPVFNLENEKGFLSKYPNFPFRNQIEDELNLSNMLLFSIEEDGLYGFVDEAGNLRVNFSYDNVSNFTEGLCAVEKDGKFGFINKKGEETIPLIYDGVSDFSDGVAVIEEKNLFYLINRNGDRFSGPFENASDFYEGLLSVQLNQKYGFINPSGNVAINFEFEKSGDFKEGFCQIMLNQKFGFLDRNGMIRIPPNFDWVESFSYGKARVKLEEKYGIIDKEGNFILKPEYNRIEKLSHGVYLLVQGEFYGFTDSLGKPITEMKYLFEGNSNPDDFISEHYLKLISEKGENLLHRKNNKKVFSSPQDLIRIPRGKKIIFKKKEKFGLSDENGNILIQPKQDELFYFGKNYYIIQKKGVYQIIDSNEKIILTLGNKLPEILDGELWLVQVSENYLVINSAKCEILYSQKAFSTKYNKESETLVFSDENIRSFFHLKSGKIIFRQTISE